MKILTLWVWAFWIATLQHIAKNHPEQEFLAYEKNEYSYNYMIEQRRNPYFFTDMIFEKNIVFVNDLDHILPSIDIIILAIPNQFIRSSIRDIRPFLRPWVSFLNLSKWIDNTTLFTVSDTIASELSDLDYSYSVLSGGMIAKELVDGKMLGAQIGTSDREKGEYIKYLFESPTLHIRLTESYKNIELYWALKNIIALYVGYLEGKGYGFSTIGYELCTLLEELPHLISLLGGTQDIEFSEYALWGDIIATCFWDSRNRYFWKLVGSGKTVEESLSLLQEEKKHAEGYETLKGVRTIIHKESRLPAFQKILDTFFHSISISS